MSSVELFAQARALREQAAMLRADAVELGGFVGGLSFVLGPLREALSPLVFAGPAAERMRADLLDASMSLARTEQAVHGDVDDALLEARRLDDQADALEGAARETARAEAEEAARLAAAAAAAATTAAFAPVTASAPAGPGSSTASSPAPSSGGSALTLLLQDSA